MRVAICAFVMLEVLATASSMNTERSQLRMVNRLTEAKPKSKSNDEIGVAKPTNVIIKKGKTVPELKAKSNVTPVDKGAVKATASKETALKPTAPKLPILSKANVTQKARVGPYPHVKVDGKEQNSDVLKKKGP